MSREFSHGLVRNVRVLRHIRYSLRKMVSNSRLLVWGFCRLYKRSWEICINLRHTMLLFFYTCPHILSQIGHIAFCHILNSTPRNAPTNSRELLTMITYATASHIVDSPAASGHSETPRCHSSGTRTDTGHQRVVANTRRISVRSRPCSGETRHR